MGGGQVGPKKLSPASIVAIVFPYSFLLNFCFPFLQGFEKFCIALESILNCSQAVTLATWFGYPPAKIDNISNGDNPCRTFIQFMAERGEISRTDISLLINAMESKVVSLNGVADNIKEAFHKHLAKRDQTPLKTDLQGNPSFLLHN